MDLESSLVWLNGRLDSAIFQLPSEVALAATLLVSVLLFLGYQLRVHHLMKTVARLELELTVAREALALEETCRTVAEHAPQVEQTRVGVRPRLKLLFNQKFDSTASNPPKAS
jgi:hypothetical protein